MQVIVTGRNFNIRSKLREHVTNQLQAHVSKYFGDMGSGNVTITKDANEFKADCLVHMPMGIDMQVSDNSEDPYSAFDNTLEKLDKKLRRYKRRLRNHHNKKINKISYEAMDYVIEPYKGEEESEVIEDNPIIIAESKKEIHEMSVSDAVMKLDLVEAPVVVFKNSVSGNVNVVYQRVDGNISWVDPKV